MPKTEQVTDILRGVIDPELGSDIVDLGMVKDVRVNAAGEVGITIALTTMGCPLRAQIKQDAVQRVGALEGVTDVKVDWSVLTSEEKAQTMATARKRIAENPMETAISRTTRVLLIASGKGGVGKSTVTVNLAVALASQGFNVGVLDADIWGFSVPRMLGLEGRLEGELQEGDDSSKADAGDAANDSTPASAKLEQSLSEKKIKPFDRPCPPGSLKVVSMGLLVDSEETALMWRGLILNRAVRHFLEDVSWGDLNYLLIDMPPGTGDVQMGIAKMLPHADMLVVTMPSQTAQKVALRVANMGLKNYLRIAGVIENMSGAPADDGSGPTRSVFGEGGGEDLAKQIKAPLLAQIPLDADIAEASDMGEPITTPAAAATGNADSNGAAAAASETYAQQVFRDLANRIVTEISPPMNMSACTARLDGGGIAGEVPVNLSLSKN